MADNLPEVATEIKDNPDVQWFYLSNNPEAKTSAIGPDYVQRIVKTYGPFYNNGGGDAEEGVIYIIFYEGKRKE